MANRPGKDFHPRKGLPAIHDHCRPSANSKTHFEGRQPTESAWHSPCYRGGVSTGLYSGVEAASASQKRLEAITGNLANLNTPAYKRVSTGTRAFQLPGRGEEHTQLYTFTEKDFTQGDLEPSANQYHVALMGPGFIAIDGPNGDLYTRNGTFHADQDGFLLTEEGYRVSWRGPNDRIEPTGEPVTIDGTGKMMQGQRSIGDINFTDFAEPSRLSPQGGGYFSAPRGLEEQASPATLYQGMLESSNSSGVDELVSLITVQRTFESARNVMQMIDQSYGRLTAAR